MGELVFEVTQDSDGGFVAECLTEAIFTQADTWEELRSNAREAVAAFLAGQAQPPRSVFISSAVKFSPRDESPT